MMRSQKTGKVGRSLRALLPAAALAAALCLPAASRAATYSYGSSARTVNAGVVFLGHASTPLVQPQGSNAPYAPDPAPYLFHTLNLRPDVKPFGWNIINPLAPRTVTQAIATRWSGYIDPNTGQVNAPPVTANMAAYWEVPLDDTSADQLRRYDVLYLPLQANYPMTPAENEKLRRFVDYGGVLLVEYSPLTGRFPGRLNDFFAALDIGTAPGVLDLPAVGSLYLRTPLLQEPYAFDRTDFSTLGLTPAATFSLSPNQLEYWGKALVGPNGTAVYAGQDGAGVMVASGLGIGPGLSPSGAFYAQTAPAPELAAQAPTPDLKFLANLITYVDSHPNENKNSRQNGSAADLASFAPAWTAPLTAGNTPPPAPGGAAIWGKYVFVTDAYGVLRAFDAVPGEDLTGSGKADDGTPDLSAGQSFDEIWNVTLGANASAPTVFSYGGSTYVMAADGMGRVTYYNVTNGAGAASQPPAVTPVAFPAGHPVPSPTYYEGRIYQAQANGKLYVFDLHTPPPTPAPSASGGVAFLLNPATATGGGPSVEYATGAPAVGTIADGDVTNDIVALVPTTQNLYTVFLGARADLLMPLGNNSGSYNINRGHLGLLSLKADMNSVPGPLGYTLDGLNRTSYNSSGTDFPGGPTTGVSLYASYDADFGLSVPAGKTLTLNAVSAFSYGTALAGGGTNLSATVSSPAGDRSGSFYYTVNTPDNQSYLIGLKPDVQTRGVHLTFRFRMPRGDGQAGDPDGVNWNDLNGYQFVGAPVVDSKGRVYAAAVNTTNPNLITATVLCFDSTQDVYAAAPGYDFSQVTVTQPDEGAAASAANTILAGGTVTNIPGTGETEFGQYLAGDGRITFFNFGRSTSQPGQVAGNLSEPQPISVQPNVNGTTGGVVPSATTLPLHTNLSWYMTPFTVNGDARTTVITGVSKVGDTVLLADSGTPLPNFKTNQLYKINAAAAVGTAKVLPPTAFSSTPLDTAIGNVRAAPSASSSVLVLNGTTGISAFTRQLTLIADNNRILETDSDGQAVWAADATVGAGGAKVDFSHPAGLSAVSSNDYLVADTGNNRCVRFDRGGKVLWELTRFSDPSHLLAAGSPLSLSAPTSAQILRRYIGANVAVSYLVADTGNSRILEVTDIYNPTTGALVSYHILTAATNTFDKMGRRYRYTSASYFPSADPTSILALVTNTRLAPLTAASVLGPVSGDAPGGSMVSLSYDSAALTATAPANQNEITGFRAIYTSFTAEAASQVVRDPNTGVVSGTTVGPATFQVRSPRFLSVFNPPSGTVPSLLYADANGAFELTTGLDAPAGHLQYTTLDYQGFFQVMPPVNFPGLTQPNNLGQSVNRLQTPFVPTSIQRLDSGGDNPRYLITQTAGQSELGTPTAAGTSSFGGEIFETDYSKIAAAPGYTRQISGYGFGPLSRPRLTGPLTQPTAAMRQ